MPITVRKDFKGRKLLVATVGLATASYVGCSLPGSQTSGNLLPPPLSDAGPDVKSDTQPPPTVGNLLPPPPLEGKEVGPDPDERPDAKADTGGDTGDTGETGDAPKDTPPEMYLPPVGNLLPPPPIDAAPDAKQDSKKDGVNA